MAIRSLCPLCRREFLTLEMEHDANKCVDCMMEMEFDGDKAECVDCRRDGGEV